MTIEIDLRTTPPSIALVRCDDFDTFKIVALGGYRHADRLGDALASIGRIGECGYAFIALETLSTLAGGRACEADWLASLDGMHSYARAHGWTDATGAIRGHVERTA
jgi:hypothetical protein